MTTTQNTVPSSPGTAPDSYALPAWVCDYAAEHGTWMALIEWGDHLDACVERYRRIAGDPLLTHPRYREQWLADTTALFITRGRERLARVRERQARADAERDATVAAGDAAPEAPSWYAASAAREGSPAALDALAELAANARIAAETREDLGEEDSAAMLRGEAARLEAFAAWEQERLSVSEKTLREIMDARRRQLADAMVIRAAEDVATAEERAAEAEQEKAGAAERRAMIIAGVTAPPPGWWGHMIWLHHTFGDRSFTTAQVCGAGQDDPGLVAPPGLVRARLADRDAPRQLGLIYSGGQAVDGARIEKCGTGRGVARWRVVITGTP